MTTTIFLCHIFVFSDSIHDNDHMRRYCSDMENRKWYTTSNKLYMEYLFDIEDTKDWSYVFIKLKHNLLYLTIIYDNEKINPNACHREVKRVKTRKRHKNCQNWPKSTMIWHWQKQDFCGLSKAKSKSRSSQSWWIKT